MKILVVGPSWVGDMVMAQTLFITLKQLHLDCVIDVLAPEWSRPLLERMPQVNKSISMPLGHGKLELKVRKQFGLKLKQEEYDQAIVLPNSFKSALIPFWAKIPLRTGWRGEWRYGVLNDLRKLDKQRYQLMIERFIALALPAEEPLPEPLPRPALRVDSSNVASAMVRFDLRHERPVLALAPGAEFGESKRWPAEHFAEVAKNRILHGWQVWIFGSAKDQPVAGQIMAKIPAVDHQHVQDLTGKTELADAVDLLSVADAVVSNDSGLMHIAAALNRPLVVLYGSTSPYFTPPLNDHKAILQLELDCSPCFERTCPLGHLDCLKKLGPERVLTALDELLSTPVEVQP